MTKGILLILKQFILIFYILIEFNLLKQELVQKKERRAQL